MADSDVVAAAKRRASAAQRARIAKRVAELTPTKADGGGGGGGGGEAPEIQSFEGGRRGDGLAEVLGTDISLLNGSGKTVGVDALAGADVVGLYFSAHWCPPCRNFTPVFAKLFEEQRAAGKKLACVFVSCDKNDKEFKDYFATMPWHAVRFGDKQRQALQQRFKVNGIPKLIFLDGDTGAVLTEAGTAAVRSGNFDLATLSEFKESAGSMIQGIIMRVVRFVFIYLLVTQAIKWFKG